MTLMSLHLLRLCKNFYSSTSRSKKESYVFHDIVPDSNNDSFQQNGAVYNATHVGSIIPK